jgi:hypothetical protein
MQETAVLMRLIDGKTAAHPESAAIGRLIDAATM